MNPVNSIITDFCIFNSILSSFSVEGGRRGEKVRFIHAHQRNAVTNELSHTSKTI
jgi:hypothetical protein